jgi:hypothetical protein
MSGDHNQEKTDKQLDLLLDDIEEVEKVYETASLASDEPFVKPKKPTPKCSAGYMVSVDGNIGPKKVHPTIEDAKAEAMRLSPSNAGKVIRILYLVGYYEPTHAFKELV